jgi:hypothetical protein
MELTHHRLLSSAAMQSSSSTSPPLTRPLQRTGYVAAEGLDRYPRKASGQQARKAASPQVDWPSPPGTYKR